MKKFIAGVVTCLLVVGMSSFVFAQGADEIINKLRVVEVNRVHVAQNGTSYYMDIDVTMANENEKELMLTDNSFNFYICRSKAYSDCRDKTSALITGIGSDVAYKGQDIPLPSMKQDIKIQFKVALGSDQAEVLNKTTEMLNFVGDPSSERTFFIGGQFDLGIKTTQGWTYADAIRIEWQFCPELLDKLPIQICM